MKLLVVEDVPQFRAAARTAFVSFDTTFASNYDEAVSKLSGKYDGVITDCFFPRNDTADISLGLEVREKLYSVNRNAKVEAFVERIAPYVNMNDELEAKFRNLVQRMSNQDIDKNPLVLAMEQVGKLLGREGATHLFSGRLYGDASKDWYFSMGQKMNSNPSFQPLGVLVAEQTKHLPTVFATGGNNHDIDVSPIIRYAGANNLGPVVDCDSPTEKTTPEFWNRAYKRLEERMQ
jgi:CheY-like chemotaxis protein